MENRVAVLSIIVENEDAVGELNELLHRFSKYIIGRMGIPYRQKNINIICIAIDAPNDEINSLTGSLGRIKGITAKATYSKI
ncbi:MAG: iron-only hydrogenase system regulator [Lachnospiraceae bacterium]|nr:iron-only hydrogenase system regulator [Lachnospiraceae bacterium]MBP5745233.1 iron-only hydrogenase system regulator [Lachnospiraceae bacterium]